MIPSEIIKNKRDGKEISKDQLHQFVNGYVKGDIPDYQMSALLMAIFFNGMSDEELFALVEIMLNSGDQLNFSNYTSYVADKHSTGGVGDKVSIILGPLLAAAGIAIPMLSGRSLGHTGGTLDKLETIPGFEVNLSLNEFRRQVDAIGISMIGQTDAICPADKKMYALRDVTGTVESIPLICGSIMSKKIAEGIQGLVLDVKTGNGAFMKNIDQARELGSMLQKIGTAFNVNTDAVYTSMEQPLGNYAGLWCEVQESIDGLLGNGPADTMEVTFELGTKLLIQAGFVDNKPEAIDLQKKLIEDGSAYQKFLEMVEYQGGKKNDIENYSELHLPQYFDEIRSADNGYVAKMDTYKIGLATVELGCGRKKTTDAVDPTAGIQFLKKVGDSVQKSDAIYKLFNSNKTKLNSAKGILNDTYSVTAEQKQHQLILS